MAGNSFLRKLDQTANLLHDEENYYSKAWNKIFEKYQDLEDPRDCSLEELDYITSSDPEATLHQSTCHDSSSESLSSSQEERDPLLKTPNCKPNSLSPESPPHTAATTQSLSLSTNSDNSLDISCKVLELNIDKLSPEQTDIPPGLSPPTPVIKTSRKSSTTQDILTLPSTQEIKLSKQLSVRPNKPRVPLCPLTPTRLFRLATLNPEEVPAEVEHMISTAFKEFVNTDAIHVLRGILTIRNYRFQGERHSKILTPYIETSISLPLKIRNEHFTLKLTPLSLLKNPNNSITDRRVYPPQTSYSPAQLSLLDRARVASKHSQYSNNSFRKLNSTQLNTNSPLTNGTDFMYPIKLLDTSPFNSALHSNRAITHLGNTSTPKGSLSRAISGNSIHTLTTPSKVHQAKTDNNFKIGLFNIKLLNTSSRVAAEENVKNNEITPVRAKPLKPNNQTHQFSVRLLETVPSANSVRYDTTRFPTRSNSVDQELKLVPLDNSPISNSTPVKRTLSKIIEHNLSKRVRLDTYNI